MTTVKILVKEALMGHVIQMKSLAIVTTLRPETQQMSTYYLVSYG